MTKRLQAVYEFHVDDVPWRVEVVAGRKTFYEYIEPLDGYVVRKDPPAFVVQTVTLIEMEEGTPH